jgi:hypothetical protein
VQMVYVALSATSNNIVTSFVSISAIPMQVEASASQPRLWFLSLGGNECPDKECRSRGHFIRIHTKLYWLLTGLSLETVALSYAGVPKTRPFSGAIVGFGMSTRVDIGPADECFDPIIIKLMSCGK